MKYIYILYGVSIVFLLPQLQGMEIEQGQQAFCDAVENGNCKAIEALPAGKIDVNRGAREDRTPLMVAASRCSIVERDFRYNNMAKLLLELGADPDRQDHDGQTALMIATLWANSEQVNLLLNRNANTNIQDDKGETALHKAVRTRSEKFFPIVKALFEAGADTTIQDNNGCTVFDVAEEDMKKLLLELTQKKDAAKNKFFLSLKNKIVSKKK